MNLKWITIGFSTRRYWTPLSWLIKWWWKIPYSHVYIRWGTPWGFDEILEASGLDVHMREYHTWLKTEKVIQEYSFAVTHHEIDRVMRELRVLTGRPYGWMQILGIIIAELLKLRHNPLSDGSKTLVCSEIGYKFLKILGYNLNGIDQDMATPKDIKDVLDGVKV